MRITEAEVRRIARLAQLQLDDRTVDRLTREMGAVLSHFEQIEELDTGGVDPTSHVGDRGKDLRADRVRPSLPPGRATENAPAREASHFKVPPVI